MSAFIFEQDNCLITAACFPAIPNHLNWKNMYFKCLWWISSSPAPSKQSDLYLSSYVLSLSFFSMRVSFKMDHKLFTWSGIQKPSKEPAESLSQYTDFRQCPFSSHPLGLQLQFIGMCNPILWYTATHNKIVVGDIMTNAIWITFGFSSSCGFSIVSQKQWGLIVPSLAFRTDRYICMNWRTFHLNVR